MKKLFYYLNLILDEANKELKNKLGLPPLAIAAIVSGAATIATKISEDRKAKKLTARADKQAAEERLVNEKRAKEAVNIARGTAREGDPTLAATQRKIQENVANTIGRVRATTGSSQEVIKAAQTVNKTGTGAEIEAQSKAAQIKLGLKNQLASRFAEAGRLRLAGDVGIDRRLQGAIDAIGANSQASVDTAQNLGKLGISAMAYNQAYPTA